MLVIVHAGQTGVERGACRAAQTAGFRIAGYMPLDQRDELGLIPADVAAPLTPHTARGRRVAVYANLQLASAVLVVVPDAATPDAFTAMTPFLQHVRGARLPMFVADGATAIPAFVTWAQTVPEVAGSVTLLVTGPRATRWQDGESVTRRLVAALALH